MRIEDLLIKHEGLRLKPYECTAGDMTIGVGRNLDSMGLSEDEVYYLLANDIRRCEQELTKAFEWFTHLDLVRQDAMMDMCFNLGISRLRGFRDALREMSLANYEAASVSFLDSNWAEQVGQRAITITNMIRTGEYDA